jgi:hypothetical protein
VVDNPAKAGSVVFERHDVQRGHVGRQRTCAIRHRDARPRKIDVVEA